MLIRAFGLVALLSTVGPCTKSASEAEGGAPTTLKPSAAGNAQAWTLNGATACERLLTPDVVGAILVQPSGTAQRDDATSCHFGPIYIRLSVHDLAAFKLEIPRIAGTHPLNGVGDVAYWNQGGAIAAVKGPDRGCDVSVLGAPNVNKPKDLALAEKLGAICTKLFALP